MAADNPVLPTQLAMADDPPPPTGEFKRPFHLQGRPMMPAAAPRGLENAIRAITPAQLREPAAAETLPLDIGGRQVAVKMDPPSRASDQQLVMVKTDALDRAWAPDRAFYVGPGGKGESAMPGRYTRFQKFLEGGGPMEAASVGVSRRGSVGFVNGRHRFAVLRDMGVKSIPVAMDPESIINARAHGLLDEAASPPVD